jgi:hypothetical protein
MGGGGKGRVIRVQDREGRGPYRPGFSKCWSDPVGAVCPPWWDEIGETFHEAHSRFAGNYHWGCGFISFDQLEAWFSRRELRKLDSLGFGLVTLQPNIVIAETPRQIVFGVREPLHGRPSIKLTSELARAA